MLKYKLINLQEHITQKITNKKTKSIVIKISGPLGSETLSLFQNLIFFKNKDNLLLISNEQNNLFGTYYSIIKNTYRGLFCGYKKFLEIRGVGYKIINKPDLIQFDLGFSSPIFLIKTKNILFQIKKNKILKIFGNNLQLVNQVASRIRLFKKPEPYKGKGVRYLNEDVKQKEGKKKKK